MERIKSAAIVFLILLMAALFAVNMMLAVPNAGGLNFFSEQPVPDTGEKRDAGIPSLCAICFEGRPEVSGGDISLRGEVSPVIFEALLTMSEPERVERDEFFALAGGSSVYMRYNSPMPLSLLTAWAGGEKEISLTARALAAAMDGAGVVLLFQSGEGELFKARTEASSIRLAEACASCSPNGFWQWEKTGGDEFWPVLEASESAQVLSFAPALAGELSEEMLEAFGFNPALSSYYKDSGGDQVYVERQSTLSLKRDGGLVYSSDDGIETGGHSESETVESCRALCARVWELAGASGELSFNCRKGDSFYFEACVEGIFLSGSWSAVVRVENGRIKAAAISPVICRATTESVSFLPRVQASAAAEGGYPLEIRYFAEGEYLIPALCTVEEDENAVE